MAESQCAVFREFGVHVTCVEPGGIATKFASNVAMPDMTAIPAEYQESFQKTTAYYMRGGESQTAEQCAQSIMEQVVLVEKPPFRVQTNSHTKDIFEKTQLDPTGEAPVKLNATRMLGKEA